MKKKQNPDTVRQFNIPVVIRFSSIAVLTVLALIAVHVWYGRQASGSKITADLTFAVAAISGIAAVISSVYAYQSMNRSSQIQERHHKIDKTLEFIAAWDDEQLASARVTVSDILNNVGGNVLDRSDYLRNHLKNQNAARQDVTVILNLLEKVAICWEADLLDEGLLKDFYQPIIQQCWELFGGYVAECRLTRNNKKLYQALERMYDIWHISLVAF